jgi:mRNA-degrading endonuclease toxin of MazEF toxin-antitoxin module
VTFDGFDVVITPFPFADRRAERKRPALVLSAYETFGRQTGVAVIAMITTGRASRWPFDVRIQDLDAAGLRHACVVRMKFATLDFRRIGPKVGRLSAADSREIANVLRSFFPIAAAD